MHKILSGQSVTDAAAGTTLVDPAEGTAAESLVGWLAVGRAATLSIWLEVEPSRSRSDASRDLEAVEKIELDGRALSLAACPRCKVYFFYTGRQKWIVCACGVTETLTCVLRSVG